MRADSATEQPMAHLLEQGNFQRKTNEMNSFALQFSHSFLLSAINI